MALLGFNVWSLFCCALLCVVSSFAIISLGKRELIGLLSGLLFNFPVSVQCLFLAVPWIGLQCAIATFPGHTHFFL